MITMPIPRVRTFVRLLHMLLALSPLLAAPRAMAAAPFNDFADGTILSDQISGVSFLGSPVISVEDGNHILRAAPEGTSHPAALRMDFTPRVNRVQVTVRASKDTQATLRAYALDQISGPILLDETTVQVGISGSANLTVTTLFQGPIDFVQVLLSSDQPEVLDKLSFTTLTPGWTGTANFDTLPNNSSIASGTLITGQYPGLLVESPARALNTSGSVSNTAPNVLAKIPAGESDTGPLRLRFSPAQGAVCLRTGYPDSAIDNNPLVVRMSAYAADGTTLLASKTKTFPSPSAINEPLEIVRYSQSDIAFVDVLFLNADGTSPKSLGGEEVIDTVQYGPVTPNLDPDTAPPVVEILTPANGTVLHTANSTQTHATLALTANIFDVSGLSNLVLRLTRTDVAGIEEVHSLTPVLAGFGHYTTNPVHSLSIGTWRVRLEATDSQGNTGFSEITWTLAPLQPTVVTSILPVPGEVYSRPIRTTGNTTLSAERPNVFLIQGRNFHPDLSVWLMPTNSQANEIYGPGGVTLNVFDRTPTSCKVFIPDTIIENWGAEYEWLVKDPWVRPGSQSELRPSSKMQLTGERPATWSSRTLSTWEFHQSQIVANGFGAFHLCNPFLQMPIVQLPGPVTPDADDQLFFQSRLCNVFENQIAIVEIQSEGQWIPLWSQVGSTPGESGFRQVGIPLGEFAGRPVNFRVYLNRPWQADAPINDVVSTNPPVGWFIDDIMIGEQPTVTTFSSLSWAEVHGFGFDNEAETDMGFNAFLATYGDNLLLPFAPIFNPFRLAFYPVYRLATSMMTGHCAGIAQMHALSNENALFPGAPLPSDVIRSPGIYKTDIRPVVSGAATYAAGSAGVRYPSNFWGQVEVFQSGQISSEFYEHMFQQIVGGGPNETLATIRPYPPAYQLALFSLTDLGNAHVVTPYRIRDIPGTNLTEIDVYDSNWPFRPPGHADRIDWNIRVNGKVVIDRSTNTFTFNRDGSHPDLNNRITSGDDLYAIPNSLFRGGRTPPGVLDLLGLGTMFSFGSADATVTDATGSQSAGWDASGTFTQNFPDLQILPVSDTTAKEGGIPQAAFLHQMQDATLKATVNVRGPNWIAGNLLNGNALYLEVDGATEGDTDLLTHRIADGRARSLRYTPDSTGADIMPRAGLELSESEAFSAEWLGLQQRAGQGLEFEILRDIKAVSVENLGTDSQRSVLKITHGSAAAQGEVRYYGPLVTPPGTRAALALSSWPSVGNATLLLDTTSDGTWDTNSPLRPLEAPATGFGAQDSNNNSIPDAIDIALGDLADTNFDGIPDTVFRPAKLRIGAQKDNAYTMHLEGQPGAQWKLQKTANLAANDWLEIATGTLDSEGLASPSITRSTDSKVFYRAIVTMTEK